jgi:cell division transport system ATP-binding protein
MITFEFVGLRYGIGPEVLSDLSFTLKPGSFHFLTGPSGSGKTSLMKLLYLAHLPTRGIVNLFGHNVETATREQRMKIRQNIGVVFQDFRLLPHLSAFDNVALPLRIAGAKEHEINKNVNEILEWVDLLDYRDAPPYTLSGGQQQRIAVARAVVTKPKLILADEPTGNLDDKIGARIFKLFEQLNTTGTSIVVATHNLHMMKEFQHPYMVLENGSMRIEQPPRNISDMIERLRNAF